MSGGKRPGMLLHTLQFPGQVPWQGIYYVLQSQQFWGWETCLQCQHKDRLWKLDLNSNVWQAQSLSLVPKLLVASPAIAYHFWIPRPRKNTWWGKGGSQLWVGKIQSLFLHYCLLIIVLFSIQTTVNLLFPPPCVLFESCASFLHGLVTFSNISVTWVS